MDVNNYRKDVYRTLSTKVSKEGFRAVASKGPRLNTVHAIIGLNTEVGELMEGMHEYLTGASQLRSSMLPNAREELGDAFFYMAVLSKELNARSLHGLKKGDPRLPKEKRVSLPGSGKRVKMQGTLTENILKLHTVANQMLDQAKKALAYNRAMDMDFLGDRFRLATIYLYAISYGLFGEAPAAIMAENNAKLRARYPQGFTNDAEKNRDLKKEAAAAAAVVPKSKQPVAQHA